MVNSAEQIIFVGTEEQQNTGLAQPSEDVKCYSVISANKVSELIPVHVVIHTFKL